MVFVFIFTKRLVGDIEKTTFLCNILSTYYETCFCFHALVGAFFVDVSMIFSCSADHVVYSKKVVLVYWQPYRVILYYYWVLS